MGLVFQSLPNEKSDDALLGMAKLINYSEIANTSQYLIDQKRDYGKEIYLINAPRIEFDPVNYLNGHYEAEKRYYLGKSANELATTLQMAGLTTGKNIILTGCESAEYAKNLANELHTMNIDVKVTGALGIAFDYKDSYDDPNSEVVESMFDKGKISKEINDKYNTKNKLKVALKYELIFINNVASKIFTDHVTEDRQKKLFSYFSNSLGKKIKLAQRDQLSNKDKEKLQGAKDEFNKLIRNKKTEKKILIH